MDPHLQRLHDQIQELTTSLSTEELAWHPAGKWSAGEILEHLYLTYIGTTKGFSRVLESAPLKGRQSWKQRAAAFMVLELGYFPTGVQAPSSSRPKMLPAEDVLTGIAPKITEMDAVLTGCASKFGADAKVMDHPLMGPFSISQWRKFHLRHGLHHMKQIDRLRKLRTS